MVGQKRDAGTAATARHTPVEVVAPAVVVPGAVAATVGVAVEKVGVATPTTSSDVAAVAEEKEARPGLASARDAATGAAPGEETGVEAVLGVAPVDGGMERKVVPTGTARRTPSPRRTPRAQTSER